MGLGGNRYIFHLCDQILALLKELKQGKSVKNSGFCKFIHHFCEKNDKNARTTHKKGNQTTKTTSAYAHKKLQRSGLGGRRSLAVVRGPRICKVYGIKQLNETFIKSSRKVWKAGLELESEADGRRHSAQL